MLMAFFDCANKTKKMYRAPIGEVQCSTERDACFKCYKENGSDVLKCKEVADAFIRCAQATTEVRADAIPIVKEKSIDCALMPIQNVHRNLSRRTRPVWMSHRFIAIDRRDCDKS